jgi:plasmid stability protein
MASVLIRNVDEILHARLKARATAHHRSLEEEARELLRAAVARQEAPARENIAALARRLFGPEHGADLNLPPRGSAPESIPPDFSSPEYERSSRA